MICEDLKHIQEIGSGVIGTIYKAILNNKEIIIKRTHVKDNEISKTIDLINDFDKFARNYTKHFMICDSYRIKKNCEFRHLVSKEFKKNADKKMLKWYNDVHNSNICLDVLYSPKLDGTLNNFIGDIDFVHDKNLTKIIPATLIQLFYIDYILRENGWIHLDMHTSNFMYKKTSNKSIIINLGAKKYNIPTYGRLWYLIDYDIISLFKINDKNYKSEWIHLYIIGLLVSMIPFWRYGTYTLNSYKKSYKYIKNSDKYEDIASNIPAEIREKEPETTITCINKLCFILYPELFCIAQGVPKNDIEKYLKIIHTNLPIRLDVILYCIRNLNNRKKMIKKLIQSIQ